MTSALHSARSYLYVPGDQPDRLAKAVDRGADALIVDLEDSVAVASKAAARVITAEWLARRAEHRCQVWIRVNADALADDLRAVVGARIDGIVVPKAEPELLREADRLLTELEHERGLASTVAVIGLVETARGLLRAAEVAAAPRVLRLGIGEADLLAELRIQPSESRRELTSLRLQVVVASAAAGIAAPVAPTSTDFRDLDAFRETTRELMKLGFRARTAVHPAQVPVINEVFTPDPDEVARARRIVAAYEAAVQRGSGVCVDEKGRMVDVAVIRSAREVLDRADRP
jgi:citrate lyase subunit beta/citryl-CoA lyase